MSNSRLARELEVLHLIAEVLLTGAVKVPFKHIYGKFDVNSRIQAVVRLRELNLP